MAHALEGLQQRAEKLIEQIKESNKNKTLARQLITGARQAADYGTEDARWSMNWYVSFIKELETRV